MSDTEFNIHPSLSKPFVQVYNLKFFDNVPCVSGGLERGGDEGVPEEEESETEARHLVVARQYYADQAHLQWKEFWHFRCRYCTKSSSGTVSPRIIFYT